MFDAGRNKISLLLVMDMQDGMYDIPPQETTLLESERLARIEQRKAAMESLAADLQPFIDQMRDSGAEIIWVVMDEERNTPYGGLFNLTPAPQDQWVVKSVPSAYAGNEDFFDSYVWRAEAEGKELEINTCGLWALECVNATHTIFHNAGYDSRIVGDMILDSHNPGREGQRPNRGEKQILDQIAQETSGDSAIKWSGELLEEHRARNPRHTPLELSL